MKNLFGLLFVCALFALTSCGSDGCEDQDFTGTYTGTNSCAGTDSDAEVTITGTDGSYAITGTFSNSSLDQDGCTLSYSNTVLGIGEEVEITLSGTTLTIVQKEAATSATLCTFTGTK